MYQKSAKSVIFERIYLMSFMNRIYKLTSLIFLLFVTLDMPAKVTDRKDVRFAYDVAFDMNFDNREFYKSNFSRSMTIFGARLTPSVGLSVTQRDDMKHKIMIGVDVMKDFGASPVPEHIAGGTSPETMKSLNHKDLFREIILYYRLDRKSGKNDFSLTAGIFPRSSLKGCYSEAFFSDSLRFYDNNLEGLLLQLDRPKAHFELGCDWMGQYGADRREKFMIFSSGEGYPVPFISLGYAAYMYHFASSDAVHGVVDNILVNPYVKADFSPVTGLQSLTLRAGWLQSMQHDRANVGHYVFPHGAEIDLDIKNWNVGIRNDFFFGTDMMPYYNMKDGGGFKYGSRLYMGDPFYRVFDDGNSVISNGTYDRFEVYYEPVIGSYIKIRVAAIFHFNNLKYSGTQQMVTMGFDLQELLGRKNK